MYNNPYNFVNNQNINDRIDSEIERLKQMKSNIQQPVQPITQNFQFAPASSGIKYASTLEDVQKEQVYGDTPYFSKDFSVLWLKHPKGDIRCFELKEIIPKDEKDMQIEYLQAQINELKGKIENDANATNVITKQVTTNTPEHDDADGTTTQESEPTSIQKVSRGKAK